AGAGAPEPVAATSIGHTSYVLKLRLSDGTKAAFKPRSKLPLGEHRYRGEIAAYRLAKALGLDSVPPAFARAFDAATLRSLEPSVAERALVDDDGRVRGAFIPWIERYEVLPLEDSRWRERWEPWLFDARSAIPEDQRALASAVSTMLVFDYVTANWDRWSGGNVARDGATGKLLFVDNDGAFYEWPAPAALAKQLGVVARIARFSRRFVGALRSLDEGAIRGAIGDESPGVPLLPPRAVAGVDARRRTALDLIDSRLGDAGASYAFE
ncbi:MAG TPA: hypothetical protein VIF09_23505, partial [Polyangiaceae bacterium]